MNDIKVLDVTLRDGGYVNDFEFGTTILDSILVDLINSKVDAIELGFLRNCTYREGRTWFNCITQAELLLLKQNIFLP